MSWKTRDTKELMSDNTRHSFRGGVRDGDPEVFYDEQGRLYYQGERSSDRIYPSSSLPRDAKRSLVETDDTFTYDPNKNSSRDIQSWDWSRDETPGHSSRSNIIFKNYDTYRKSPKMNFSNFPGRVLPASYGEGFAEDTIRGRRLVREGSLTIEEHIVSHERPWLWPLFLIAGLLLVLDGILSAIFCTDKHFFAVIWVPIFIIAFAVAGAVHKGIYRGDKRKWRNNLHIVAGVIATVLVFFGISTVMIDLNHVTLGIVEKKPKSFLDWEQYRMMRFNDLPAVKLGADYVTNIWVCYSLDWVAMVLLIICLAIPTSTLVIANNYYNSNYEYRREVEPFCAPNLFNPYSQVTVAQAMAFLGIVIKTTAHGNVQAEWQDYWLTVWSAIFPMLAGPVTAIALKRIGLSKGKAWCTVAFLLQMLSILVIIVMFTLTTILLRDNVLAFAPGPMSVTAFSKELLTYSVIMFTFNDVVLLVALAYCIALFIRLIKENRKDNYQEETIPQKRYHIEERNVQPLVFEQPYVQPQPYRVDPGIRIIYPPGTPRY